MAISGGDGSIILTTKVDTSGIIKGSAAIKSSLKGAEVSATTFGAKATLAVNRVGLAMKTLLGYFIGIQTVFAAINFTKQASEFATQTEASGRRLADIYGEASNSVGDFIDQNARAIGMSKALGTSIASTYGNLFSVWADQSTNAALTNQYLNMTAVIASKTGRTVEEVQERIRSGLLGNTEAIEDLGIFVNVKTIEMTDAFKRMADGKTWEQLDAYTQQQIRTMAILEQSTAKYGTTVAETSSTVRNQYQAAYEDFKNTWGQVVNTILIPVLKVLTQIFDIATKGLQIIAGLTGKTIETSNEFSSQEKAIGGAVENQEALTDAVKGTNKELKKTTASFDDIEILSSNDAGNANDTGATGTSGGVGGIGDMGENNSSPVDQISGDMTAIMGIVGGALVAVGLLLLFSGQIGWGIGFIIAGAAIFSVSMAAISESDQVTPISENLMAILEIAGIALTAIGLILLFSGSFLWGIAFIIAGAAALSVTLVALEQGKITEETEKTLLDIMTIAGVAMLALGVILLCFGVINPLSIGLIVAGAASLAGAIALNPQLVFETVSKFFTDNAGLIVGISLALLVLGIVLCVCGIVTPLSIGLIVVGVAGLATEVALNWNYITESITNFFQDNAGLIVGISIALVVLGIILLFTGVGIPLAIGLIVAGGGALAATVALNWNYIVDMISDVWDSVCSFWDKYIAPIFTAEWWINLGKTCINGLIGGFEGGINGVIGAFEGMINWIIDGINKISFEVPDWVPGIGGQKIGFNIPRVDFGEVKIPRLAKGTVLPGGKPFLAIVNDQPAGQTNIEAPLDTIVEAFNIALLQNENGGTPTREEHYYLDKTELMSIVYKLVKGGERIAGESLVTGG